MMTTAELSTRHPQASLIGDPGVFVDAELREIIEWCHTVGARTYASCQNEAGEAYILFESAGDLDRFTLGLGDLLVDAPDLYADATNPRGFSRLYPGAWNYACRLYVPEESGGVETIMRGSVRFPSAHLSALREATRRLRQDR